MENERAALSGSVVNEGRYVLSGPAGAVCGGHGAGGGPRGRQHGGAVRARAHRTGPNFLRVCAAQGPRQTRGARLQQVALARRLRPQAWRHAVPEPHQWSCAVRSCFY